jgi:hypothetical protein
VSLYIHSSFGSFTILRGRDLDSTNGFAFGLGFDTDSSRFFHVPVSDEVFAERRLGTPDEQVSVEKCERTSTRITAPATNLFGKKRTFAA